jgi:hypothetical protein
MFLRVLLAWPVVPFWWFLPRLAEAGRGWLPRSGPFLKTCAAVCWPRLTVASVLVVAGHTATFVVAARVAGCTAPLGELLALLLVVQTAVVIPLSVGGWGLREGVAAWAFAAAGLGAATGVTVAMLYAVLMLVAVAPGAGLLVSDAVRRRRAPRQPDEPRRRELAPAQAGVRG